MPRTYGGKAAEDIEFRMGLMGAALPSRGGLTAGPVTTSASRGSVPGIPGAGIMGSIPGSALGTGAGTASPPASGGGMTGGQLGLSILGGVASFMGGYQRNPGLLQISRNMNYALRESFAQQQAAARAAQMQANMQQIAGGSPINSAKSAAAAKNRALGLGMIDEAMKFAQLEDTYMDNDLQQAKEDRAAIEANENQFLQVYNRRIQKQMDVMDSYERLGGIIDQGRADPSSLSDADRAAIIITFAKQQSPEALSDAEYKRNIRDRNLPTVIRLLAGPLGAMGISSGQVASNTVIKNLASVIHQNAQTAASQLNKIAALGKTGGKDLDLPTYAPPGSFGSKYQKTPSHPYASGGWWNLGNKAQEESASFIEQQVDKWWPKIKEWDEKGLWAKPE